MALPIKAIRQEAFEVRRMLYFYKQCIREGMRFVGTDGSDYSKILAEDIDTLTAKLDKITD